MNKVAEIRAKCRQTVYDQGHYIAGYIPGVGGIARRRRKQCGRNAQPNGYCWQHQDVAKILRRVDSGKASP